MNIRQKLLAAAIISALASSQNASSATITVNTTSDGAPLIGSDVCTLRLAVEAANTNSAQAGCAAGSVSQPDVIAFEPSVLGGTITLLNGPIQIASSITIEKPLSSRRTLTVSGGNASGIFVVFDEDFDNAFDVTLRGLSLINASTTSYGGAVSVDRENLTIDGCTLQNNYAEQGGAIATYGGELTLRDSTMSNNSAQLFGGAIRAQAGSITLSNTQVSNNSATYGGGFQGQVNLDNVLPVIDIRDSTFSDNTADFDGGAIGFVGNVALSNSTFSNNTAGRDGGGVFARNTLTVNDVEFTGNSAGLQGGAIASATGTTITVANSQLIGNFASSSGGAIDSRGGTAITGTILRENATDVAGEPDQGGAIFHSGPGQLSLTDSQLALNYSSYGGGLRANGPVAVSGSTFSANTATIVGGALYVSDGLTLTGSTLSGNTANIGAALRSTGSEEARIYDATIYANTRSIGGGSGVYASISATSPLVVRNSTLIANDPSAMVSLSNTQPWIVSNSVIFDSAVEDCFDTFRSIDENVNNFIGDGSCSVDAVGFQSGDPMLGTLQDNGGLTLTHAPLSGSPLVDGGTNVNCASVDQTGTPRPIDGNADGLEECDIGSVEFLDLFAPLANLSSPPSITTSGGATQAIEITYTDLDGEIDTFSAGISDITVSPGPLTVQSVALSGSASQLTVTYTVAAPGGSWEAVDSGTYTVILNANEVLDTAATGANPAAAGPLGSFVVAITEIDIQGNGVSIADGDDTPSDPDATRFNDVPLQSSASRTFSITNTGGGTLNLTQPVEVFGQGFSVVQPSETSLGAGQSTQFQVLFEPAMLGEVVGQVTVVNNDSDENPYTFAVQANGVVQEELIFLNGFEDN